MGPRIASLLLLLSLSACVTYDAGTLSVVSTADSSHTGITGTADGRATGRDCVQFFLGFPVGKAEPQVSAAVREALKDGRYLSDVEIQRQLLLAILYERRCLIVRGDVRR